jgi:hypothetical protein
VYSPVLTMHSVLLITLLALNIKMLEVDYFDQSSFPNILQVSKIYQRMAE